MRKALLLAAALAALALPGAAGAYSLPAADISVRVAPDGSLLIAEHITIEGAFHGAYRDIPLRKGESIDRIQLSEQGEKYTRGGSTKLGSIDTPHTFNYELHKNKVRIVWHFSAGGEPHTYTVAYRFRGLAVAYSDIVDVNLKVWGANWSAPVSDLRATMTLPKPTTLGPLYNVWGHPAWVKGVVERTKPAALLRAVNVSAGQFVEMRVTFPRSLLRSTGGAKVVAGPGLAKVKKEEADDQADYLHDQEKIDDAKHHLARTLVFLALLGIGPALAWMILVWALYGRERGTGYDREYEQAPADRHRAGARAAAAAPGQDRRLAGVHGDPLRPDSPRPLQVDAGDDGAKGLGRPAPPGHLRPAAHARRHEHVAARVRGPGRGGDRLGGRHRRRAAQRAPREDREEPDRRTRSGSRPSRTPSAPRSAERSGTSRPAAGCSGSGS